MYAGDHPSNFLKTSFSLHDIDERLLGFHSHTSSSRGSFFSNSYASYGSISKGDGLVITKTEVPAIKRNSQGLFSSSISLADFDLEVLVLYESEITFEGSLQGLNYGVVSMKDNSILWSKEWKKGWHLNHIFKTASDTVLWFQIGLPAEKGAYLQAVDIYSGDSLRSIPLSQFYPENPDSNFSEYQISRSYLAKDTFYVIFESINPKTQSTLGYTTARKWIKLYDPNNLEGGALDSIAYHDHNLDYDYLEVAGRVGKPMFYRWTDSIYASGDSGLKTFQILNWKNQPLGEYQIELQALENSVTGAVDRLHAIPYAQNGFILLKSYFWHTRPSGQNHYGERLVLYDSLGTEHFDVVTDSIRPSFSLTDLMIDKEGFTYFQVLYINDRGDNPRGRISLSGSNRYLNHWQESIGITNQQISIYPNPANNLVIVESTSPIQTIWVYNSFGKPVLVDTHPVFRYFSREINLEGLSKGLYTVKVKTDDGLSEQKLMKF